MSEAMPVMGDVAKTATVRRPRSLPNIPLGHTLSDSAYLLHRVFGRDVTEGAHLRYW